MLGSTAQVLKLTDAKFQKGDNMEWKNTTFDDSRWKSLSMLKPWTEQGISNPNNYAWYRIRFTLPESMLDNSDIKETVLFAMGRLPGWIAHYLEWRHDPYQKIGRPRQVYSGPELKKVVPINQR